MKNILVFDSSSSNVFIFGTINGKDFSYCLNYEKSKMSVSMPEDMIKVKELIINAGTVEIMVGTGPGSFTGIKSGLSLFLSMIYSLGIRNVRMISSSRLFSAFHPGSKGILTIVTIPFNKGEFFISAYDGLMNPVLEDLFVRIPFNNLSEKIGTVAGSEAILVSPITCGTDLVNEISRFFKINGIFSEKFVFAQESLEKLSSMKTVDVSKEPMILNYVTHPANIDENCDIYVKD